MPNTVSGTEYITADHLGSTRLVTDASGNSTRCYDYLPFGEEIPNGYGGRTASCFGATSYPSAPDAVSEKFTGKERDAETGLDYFGARYFSGTQGRFTSPDKLFADQHLENPQSWNLYAYTLNNPLRYIDDNGEGTRPAEDARVQQVLNRGENATINQAILQSPNYSPWALGREVGRESLSSSLIGVAGEAEMVDRMNSRSLFGLATFQPRPPGGGQPDIMLNYADPFGTAVLTNIVGPGGLGYVPLAAGPGQAYLEVKASSDFDVLLKGAMQTAATAASIPSATNAVAALVVDQGAWQKLNNGQQQQLLKTVGGGFIQLQKNLISDSIKRASKLKKDVCKATQDCQQ